MKFSSDFVEAALTEKCKSEEFVPAAHPKKFPCLNSPGCNFQRNVKSSLPPLAFGLITLFCPRSLKNQRVPEVILQLNIEKRIFCITRKHFCAVRNFCRGWKILRH